GLDEGAGGRHPQRRADGALSVRLRAGAGRRLGNQRDEVGGVGLTAKRRRDRGQRRAAGSTASSSYGSVRSSSNSSPRTAANRTELACTYAPLAGPALSGGWVGGLGG